MAAMRVVFGMVQTLITRIRLLQIRRVVVFVYVAVANKPLAFAATRFAIYNRICVLAVDYGALLSLTLCSLNQSFSAGRDWVNRPDGCVHRFFW